ncbi:MAG: DUF58 domain-containing protein [Ruminiclostridium sp.]
MRRNRFTFIFLFIISIIFRYNFGGFVPSVLFNTLLSLLIISIAYTLYVYYRFKFVQDIDKRVIIKGESIKLIIKLSNEDLIIFPYVYVSFFGSHSIFNANGFSQSLSITPFSKKEFIFDMECKYRGQYEVGISNIYIEDFLGLFRLKYKIPETKKIIVYPKIEHLNNFDVFSLNCSDSQSLSQGITKDFNNIKDLRDYYYGDSFKKIHWKLTARNNKLMIKNFHSTTDANINILLDLRQNNYTEDINIIIEDKLIEAVVSVLHYYLFKSISVNYMYSGEKLEVLRASNQAEFELIYKTLASVDFNQKVSLADIIKLHYESSNTSTDIIIFTSILDVDLYNEMYNAQMSNHTICLIYISPKALVSDRNEIVDDILDNLPEIGVRAYTINPNDDIKIILGG